ncbi:DUF1517 domain-containing protein [Microcoleus sp. FACHB-68]|uniref:DUF1517 domain-containing protein n=1 Tax=Microcoleus sp. FACHB-68 TaxID=2692826 RepID=UPI0016845ED3|nr:DUF1517 domain-containing protein [Microcoleus sp. FACHB-68]MBD1940494.1 DUF1517 domain-containing protein [Microcoleus sp. FACHB-68]
MTQNNERDNDIVTVTKLQIALSAQASSVPAELSKLSLSADTETPEGLWGILQNTSQLLLTNSEYWTHVLTNSQTVASRQEAETVFERVSLNERSKFSTETLSNVDGEITQRQPDSAAQDEESAAYIVVTLLIGTADDQPLFGEIKSTEAVKEALEQLLSMRTDYLMVFELLWSPQAETDKLTQQQMALQYADMMQIAE